MIEQFILSAQRLARESAEHQFRGRALALLSEVIPFDSGSWGTVRPDGIGVKPYGVQLFGQTEALLHSYAAVRAHDRFRDKAAANPGQTQMLSWRDGQTGAHEAFRGHCEAFGHFNILSTMSESLLGSQHNFLTVARGKTAPSFNEAERMSMQQLVPHLLDAWIVSRSWHMKTSLQPDQPGDSISAICSSKGELLGDHLEFSQMIGAEFPGWSPPLLPPAIMAALEQQGCWRWKRLVVNPHPVADIIFLTARVANEIDKLTARELTIAREAAQGFSYKEIARSLGLSPATVRAHLHNIYGKLEISNKTALSRTIRSGVKTVSSGYYYSRAQYAA